MSLYRHVRDKNDVLDEVVDRLLRDVWRPKSSELTWRVWVAEAADLLRRFLVDQPAALQVYLSHPVTSPAAVARMESIMAVLRPVTGDEDEARRAYAAIHTYTVGFAALEASRSGSRPAVTGSEELAEQLAAYTTSQQFAIGLHYLLQGICQLENSQSSAHPATLRPSP